MGEIQIREIQHSRTLTQNIETVMHGQSGAIRRLLAAFASGGHVLLEDYPGTGKTTLVRSALADKAYVSLETPAERERLWQLCCRLSGVEATPGHEYAGDTAPTTA